MKGHLNDDSLRRGPEKELGARILCRKDPSTYAFVPWDKIIRYLWVNVFDRLP
ncbi:hypothetical protein PILCRDRAFT_820196 [Piloderma croceum F 1598]|uniref:Uncharacterized protein n=1 Tax=Piloderma croceum (strain F 1598) TaxID=765440 RepID=A0A0C3FEL4_PILCF|nr:hypothetical protein PILCRDRAFT_820196 [Piloderma croceum F 1598]